MRRSLATIAALALVPLAACSGTEETAPTTTEQTTTEPTTEETTSEATETESAEPTEDTETTTEEPQVETDPAYTFEFEPGTIAFDPDPNMVDGDLTDEQRASLDGYEFLVYEPGFDDPQFTPNMTFQLFTDPRGEATPEMLERNLEYHYDSFERIDGPQIDGHETYTYNVNFEAEPGTVLNSVTMFVVYDGAMLEIAVNTLEGQDQAREDMLAFARTAKKVG